MSEIIEQITRCKTAYTHAGTFHADDILAAALLKIINPDIKIKRTTNPENHINDFMFDIGGGKYDHHDGTKKRANGIPYAAFGLLMADIYPMFMTTEQYQVFDDVFIKEIDNCDNTPNTNPLSVALALFNPVWNSDISTDIAFMNTVEFVMPYLRNIIHYFANENVRFGYYLYYDQLVEQILRYLSKDFESRFAEHDFGGCVYDAGLLDMFLVKQRATYGKKRTSPLHILMLASTRDETREFLKEMIYQKIRNINAIPEAYNECNNSYEGKRVLILERYVPYEYFASERNILYVIFPSNRTGYNICCIQMTKDEKQRHGIEKTAIAYRKLFSKRLRGLPPEQLKKEFNGLTFVHSSGFMANCETKQQAIDFCYAQMKEI